MQSRTIYSCLRALLSVAVGCAAQNTLAESNWDVAASVSPGIVYTDNVCLSNTDKQDSLDWSGIGLLTPSGSISSKGSRTSFNLNGSVQFNTLTDGELRDDGCAGGFNGDREQFAPNLNATGSAILIEDWLNVSAYATANQNDVSPFVGGANDTLNRNGNTNTYYLYSVSPVISRRLKDMAKYNIRYTYNEVINTQDTVSDSTSSALAANLANDTSSQVSWNWQGNYRKVEYSESDFVNPFTGLVQPRQDTELKSAGLQLGYQIDRRWQVNASTGWEWNDFETFDDEDTGGSVWDLGARWTPTPRTTASLGMTDRFYGKAPRINVSHTRKRSVFTGSYNKSITFSNDIRTQQDLLNPNYINNFAANSNGPVLDERLTLGYSYTGRRATLGVSGNHSEQTQQDNGEQSTFQGLALSVSPQLSRVYSVSGTMAWNESDSTTFAGNQITDFANGSETWITNVTVGRPLNSRARLSLNYQYTDQQSDSSFGGYQENRVVATVNISL